MINLYAKSAFQGTNTSFGKSFSDYPNFNKPQYIVGLNFLMDLDFESTGKRAEAVTVLTSSNQTLLARELAREQERLNTLTAKLDAAYKIYDSLIDLSSLQLKKLENEQRLLNLGRSSLYQILQYEQDYLRSEEMLFAKLIEVKTLENDLNLYHQTYSSAERAL